MNEHERVVRETWERAELCERVDHKAFAISMGGSSFTRACKPDNDALSEDEAWAAAYDFTQKRLQAIAEVREEIEEVLIWKLAYEDESCGSATCERILSRLQAALADLERGMVRK